MHDEMSGSEDRSMFASISSDLMTCLALLLMIWGTIFALSYFQLKIKQVAEVHDRIKRNKINVFLEVNEDEESVLTYKGVEMSVFDFVNIIKQIDGPIRMSLQAESRVSYGYYIYVRETIKKNIYNEKKDNLCWTDYLLTTLNPKKKPKKKEETNGE